MKKQKMEKTQPAVDDRVLQFLAERHAEAEDVLDSMVEAVGGVPEVTDSLLELVYRGLRHEADVAQARQEGYVEGRNEQIEVRRRSFDTVNPRDDGGIEEDPDLPLLRHIRRSVWD